MYINPNWRILTIGDGDLSFSSALLNHHQVKNLTATIFDDKATLTEKYGDSFYQRFVKASAESTYKKSDSNYQVLTGFDVTNENTWQGLAKQQFDVVIFQFPLLPAFSSAQEYQQKSIDKQGNAISMNTLHRILLRKYLLNCFEHFLDENGAQLAFITSKNVKPYRQWNIEDAIVMNTDISFIGSMNFDIKQFPDYKIRNVDRDKHVKDTQGTIYVYTTQENSQLIANFPSENELKDSFEEKLDKQFLHKYDEINVQEKYCQLCRAGAFLSSKDKEQHLQTKKHQEMLEYEQQWLRYLAS